MTPWPPSEDTPGSVETETRTEYELICRTPPSDRHVGGTLQAGGGNLERLSRKAAQYRDSGWVDVRILERTVTTVTTCSAWRPAEAGEDTR